MADAIPVTPAEPAQKAAKKGASAGIKPEVLEQLKNPEGVSVDASFKVSGGVSLESHKAVREDF